YRLPESPCALQRHSPIETAAVSTRTHVFNRLGVKVPATYRKSRHDILYFEGGAGEYARTFDAGPLRSLQKIRRVNGHRTAKYGSSALLGVLVPFLAVG